MFSLLNYKEWVFVAMACLELHLQVAEREANGIVQDPHCTSTYFFSKGAVVSLSKA